MRTVWRGWMRLVRALARAQLTVLLLILHLTAVALVRFGTAVLRQDPLARDLRRVGWRPFTSRADSWGRAARQG